MKDKSIIKLKRKATADALEKKTLRQKVLRLEQRLVRQASMKKQAQDLDEAKHALQIDRTKGGKHLSLQGTFALAIRRNFSNCATADIGAVLLEDISRFTVSRAEGRAGAALAASARLFYRAMYEDIIYPDGSFHVAFHSYRQDATNAGILRGSKLAALILHSAYLRDYPEDSEDAADGNFLCSSDEWAFDDWFESIIRVADILPVEGADSVTTASQTLKHLQGLGCITWKDVQKKKEEAENALDRPNPLQQLLGNCLLWVYVLRGK